MARAEITTKREQLHSPVTLKDEHKEDVNKIIRLVRQEKRRKFLRKRNEILTINRLTMSLARLVFIFYNLGQILTYLPHISHFLSKSQDMTGKKRSKRTSPRLQAGLQNSSSKSSKSKATISSKEKTTPKPTKTQLKKHLKSVRESKALALRTQEELKALRKKHAEEEKAMEKMIADAQKMDTAINISSDESSHGSGNSASSQSEESITESAFAKSARSTRTLKQRAARKKKKLQKHLNGLEEGNDNNSDYDSNNQDDSDGSQDTVKALSSMKNSVSYKVHKEGNTPNDDKGTLQETEEVQEDDVTVAKQNYINIKSNPPALALSRRKHIIFCKGKVTVPKNDSPSKKMRTIFMSFMTTLLKIDKKLLIFEHNDANNIRYISSPQQIPDTLSNIQKFFDGSYRPNSEQLVIWFQLKIGIDVPEESNFFMDAKCLFDEKKKHAIYRKDIQVPETETIGYFLFSHGKQNRDRLTETIQFLLKEYYKITNPISFRWQKVITRFAGKGQNMDNNENISKAYHIEVGKGTGDAISKAIAHMYSSTRKNKPHNEKMRFVPYPRFLQNTATTIQYNKIKLKQAWYLKLTGFATSFDIAELDEPYEGMPSLRAFIMEMETKDAEPLFLSVDFSFDGKCVLFVFPLAHESEAHNKIADLPSYGMYKHGINFLRNYFHPEAYEKAEEAPWNEEEGRAISKLSEEFDNILKDCEGLSWLKDPGVQQEVKENGNPVQEIRKPALFNLRPNDDASLDTFGMNTEDSNKRSVTPEKDPQSIRKRKKSRMIGSDVIMNQIESDEVGELTDDEDDVMDIDEVTVNTLSSRMQNIETSFQHMNDNIANTIKAQFAQFFQNQPLYQPPGAARTSTSAQQTPILEGTQVNTSLASAGGVDC